jgi:hypothetical protein
MPPLPHFYALFDKFVSEVLTTFPEYASQKWWTIGVNDELTTQNAYNYCATQYPKHATMILNKNPLLFENEIDSYFLPEISFKNIWEANISDATRSSIWKYLQIILMIVVPGTYDDVLKDVLEEKEENNDDGIEKLMGIFDDTNIDDTIDKIKQVFENLLPNTNADESDSDSMPNIPNMPDLESLGIDFDVLKGYVEEIMRGRLGTIATEFAEEALAELNLSVADFSSAASTADVLKKLKANPAKLMTMAKTISAKLDSKIKSGEISEDEIKAETTQFIEKIQNMPGIDKLQKMIMDSGILSKLANFFKGGNGAPPSKAKMEHMAKMEKMRTRLKAKYDAKQKQKQEEIVENKEPTPPALTEEELIALFDTPSSLPTNTFQGKKRAKKHKKK